MSGANQSPPDRLFEPDAKVPKVRGLSEPNKDWLAAHPDHSLDSLVTLARLKESHRDRHLRLMECLADQEDRRILVGIHQAGGTATYDEIGEWSDLSRKRLRERITALVEDEVLAKTRQQFVVVSWADEAVEILAEDALATWFGRA